MPVINVFFFFFFKERLGLKLTHKRITTKVVLSVSKGKGAIQGEVKMCKEGESYDDKLLKSTVINMWTYRDQLIIRVKGRKTQLRQNKCYNVFEESVELFKL